MNMSDLVSIITPAYNSENYLVDCIKSVLNQTYVNWEMIIVDDCSKDNTYNLGIKYAEKDSRIKVIKNATNQGVANSRNTAIENSKGKYIAFLDSDDMWKPEKLATQIKFMKQENIAFSFTSYEIINEEGSSLEKVFKVPKLIDYKQYLKNTIIGCLTVMIDTEKLGKIKMSNSNLEDVVMWMEILKKEEFAYGINENLAYYRVSNSSVSANKVQNAIKYYNILRKNQELNFFYSIYCEASYIFNAAKKRIF